MPILGHRVTYNPRSPDGRHFELLRLSRIGKNIRRDEYLVPGPGPGRGKRHMRGRSFRTSRQNTFRAGHIRPRLTFPYQSRSTNMLPAGMKRHKSLSRTPCGDSRQARVWTSALMCP